MLFGDISLELSEHHDLLQKHFPKWMKRTMTEKQVLNTVLSSEPKDYNYNDGTGVFFHKDDVLLRIVFERGDKSGEDFNEPWVRTFCDKNTTRQPIYIYYGETCVQEITCAHVDGCRYVIPLPRSATDLTISPFHYRIGRILLHPNSGNDFDSVLRIAGITVSDRNEELAAATDSESTQGESDIESFSGVEPCISFCA